MKPLAIDLYCGLGGWADGLIAEGWNVVGFDIEAHHYGDERYPAALVIQDVLSLSGAQFSQARLIVASPPCQKYSYMAMPWRKAKAKAAAIRADQTGAELARLNQLFNACFRIQREAIDASGQHIPLVVENVRGAQPWVGRAAWNFGSYYLWGDVPALMPVPIRSRKNPGFRFDGSGRSFQTESVMRHVEGQKVPSLDGEHRTAIGKGARFTSRDSGVEVRAPDEGFKSTGMNWSNRDLRDWFSDNKSASRTSSAKSSARKAAAAKIAKIPFALSSWIARTYYPKGERGNVDRTT